MPDSQNILVTIAGPDQPGITSTLMEIIVKTGNELRDMGQAVTHGLLSLSFMIKIINDKDQLIKELLFASDKMGQTMTYQNIDPKINIENTSREKFVLNCVAPKFIHARFVADVSKVLSNHNINILRIDNLTPAKFRSLEITTSLPDEFEIAKLKKELLEVSTKHAIDVAFLKDNVYRRSKRLIVFDMDSTLIQTEVIDELADRAGVGPEVREITERAMNGELDFNQSLTERVSRLKGLPVEEMQDILDNLPLTNGCADFIKTVKGLGYKLALISGGFSFFAEGLKDRLGLDYAFANELEIKSGKLTGRVVGQIVNAEQKALLLKIISQQEKIALEQTVAIGDGANDLPMLSAAGLGIAYHAKDIVRKNAEQHMSHGPMTSILYFLGIPDPEDN